VASWTFEPLDAEAFPAVDLARRAGRWGGSAPAVYNAANEEGVEAFHAGEIGFLDIVDIVQRVLAEHAGQASPSTGSAPSGGTDADVGSALVADDDLTVDLVLAADTWARRRAQELASTQESAH
jgi:1-deoxy-D-xylulose-5-phosphate reductoisomerase